MENENGNDTVSTFDFPIGNIPGLAPMNNIPLSTLPNFNGQISEDPNTFMFEFDVCVESYDYTTNAQKLKIFPATLKGSTLIWFMGLGVDSITS
jgi:hypothetical protein